MKSARFRKLVVSALVVGLCFAVSTSAHAQEDAVRVRYEKARDALKKGEFDNALSGFRACIDLANDQPTVWQAMMGAALTYQRMKRPRAAVEYYRRFLSLTQVHSNLLNPKWHARRDKVTELLSAMEKTLLESYGVVSVVSTPAVAELWINGNRAGAAGDGNTPMGVYLRAGEHTVSVRLKGHVSHESKVTIVTGRLSPLEVTLSPVVETATSQPPLNVKIIQADSPVNVTAWSLVGSGTGLIILGGVFSGLAADAQEEQGNLSPELGRVVGNQRFDSLDDKRESRITASWVLYGLGGAVLLAGSTWLIMDALKPDLEQESARGIQFSAFPQADGGMGVWTWSF